MIAANAGSRSCHRYCSSKVNLKTPTAHIYMGFQPCFVTLSPDFEAREERPEQV